MNWIRRKRIGRLRTRVAQMSGGEFLDFSLDENGILARLKCHGDIPCVSASGIPHLYSEENGWRVSPLYLQNAAKWQREYEPVIQTACIEASVNGLEIVKIDKETGKISDSDYVLQPIAGMEEKPYGIRRSEASMSRRQRNATCALTVKRFRGALISHRAQRRTSS